MMPGKPTPKTIARFEFVDNAPVLVAVEQAIARGGITWSDLAAEVGVTEAVLAHTVGKRAAKNHYGRYMRYERAVQIARVIGADPVDVGV
jgi:hypothetical protein